MVGMWEAIGIIIFWLAFIAVFPIIAFRNMGRHPKGHPNYIKIRNLELSIYGRTFSNPDAIFPRGPLTDSPLKDFPIRCPPDDTSGIGY